MKLPDLSAAEVDQWLARLSLSHSTRTVQEIRRSLQPVGETGHGARQGEAERGRADRVPTGRAGRRSKSLSAEQADDVLTKTTLDRLHSYIVVSLLPARGRGAASLGADMSPRLDSGPAC